MFSSVGWAEIMILMIAGLVILGPERLPDALKWTLRSVRQVRDYATGATNQLKEDLGADFEDLRKPLAELNELRGMSPRKAITKHLLDGDDSFFTGNFDAETKIKPVSKPLPTTDDNSQVIGTGATPKPSLSKAPSASGDTASTQSAASTKSAVSPQKAVSTHKAVSTTEAATAPTGEISGVDRWDAT